MFKPSEKMRASGISNSLFTIHFSRFTALPDSHRLFETRAGNLIVSQGLDQGSLGDAKASVGISHLYGVADACRIPAVGDVDSSPAPASP